MMLILNGIGSVFVRVKAIKLGSKNSWVHYVMIAHWAGPAFTGNALMPASLYIELVGSCSKLRQDTSEMLIATVVDHTVWLTIISHFDLMVYSSFARRIRLQLSGMS